MNKNYPKCKTCNFCSNTNTGCICEFDNENLPMADDEGNCENYKEVSE